MLLAINATVSDVRPGVSRQDGALFRCKWEKKTAAIDQGGTEGIIQSKDGGGWQYRAGGRRMVHEVLAKRRSAPGHPHSGLWLQSACRIFRYHLSPHSTFTCQN